MSGRAWRLLRTGPGAPAWNLACDEALLKSADDRPILRLYAWQPPALSLGHFQPLEPFLPMAREAGLDIVRRPTGGGAIHHDDELTFCVVATPGSDGYPAGIVEAYEHVHEILRRALGQLGAELHFRGGDAPLSVAPRQASLCFEDTTAFDLVDGSGRKVVGSAQRRMGGRVLHHGSIPLSLPALTPGSGSVELVAGRPVAWDAVADATQAAFARSLSPLDLAPDALSEDESGMAAILMNGRYAEPSRTRA